MNQLEGLGPPNLSKRVEFCNAESFKWNFRFNLHCIDFEQIERSALSLECYQQGFGASSRFKLLSRRLIQANQADGINSPPGLAAGVVTEPSRCAAAPANLSNDGINKIVSRRPNCESTGWE